jgi:hypothetical protein
MIIERALSTSITGLFCRALAKSTGPYAQWWKGGAGLVGVLPYISADSGHAMGGQPTDWGRRQH